MMLEGVQISSRIRKVNGIYSTNLEYNIQYFVDLRKKCILVHFYCVLTCILVFYV